MKATRLIIMAVIMAAGAGLGCVAAPAVELINNSGGDVVLQVSAEEYATAPRKDLIVFLKQGARRTFYEGPASARGVRIVTSNCLIRYDLPKLEAFTESPGSDRNVELPAPRTNPVPVQLERDLKFYIVSFQQNPRAATGKLGIYNSPGFPLAPTWMACH